MKFFIVTEPTVKQAFLNHEEECHQWKKKCNKFFASHGFSAKEMGIDSVGFPSAVKHEGKPRKNAVEIDPSQWKDEGHGFYVPKKRAACRKDYEALGQKLSMSHLEVMVGFKSERKFDDTPGRESYFIRTCISYDIYNLPEGTTVVLGMSGKSSIKTLQGCERISDVRYEEIMEIAKAKKRKHRNGLSS